MSSELKVDDVIDMAAIEAELRPQSSERLKFRFFECYNGAAALIAEASVCIKLLKERGDAMTGVPMVGTYLRIASGQVLPELVWKFIESPNRQVVERLPLDDQKRLAADTMVPVIEAKPEGGYTKRMIDLVKAPAAVARLVAGPEGIRSVDEQMAMLGSDKVRQTIAKAGAKDDPGGEVAEEPLRHQMTVKLTDSELEEVRVEAARAGISTPMMLRRLLLRGMKR